MVMFHSYVKLPEGKCLQHLIFPCVGSIPIFPICESAKLMFSSANQLGRGLSIHGHVLDAWEIRWADVQELTYKNCKTRRFGGRSICKKCTRQDNQIIPSRSLLTPQRLSAFDCFMAGGQRRLFSAAPGVWWVSVWLKSFRVSMPWETHFTLSKHSHIMMLLPDRGPCRALLHCCRPKFRYSNVYTLTMVTSAVTVQVPVEQVLLLWGCGWVEHGGTMSIPAWDLDEQVLEAKHNMLRRVLKDLVNFSSILPSGKLT